MRLAAAFVAAPPCCSGRGCLEAAPPVLQLYWTALGTTGPACGCSACVQHTRSRCLPVTAGLHSPVSTAGTGRADCGGIWFGFDIRAGRRSCVVLVEQIWLLCLPDSSIVCCVQRCCSWGRPRQLACSNCCAGTCPWKCVVRPLSSAASGRERQNGFDSRVA
jgi:hypothetical protein